MRLLDKTAKIYTLEEIGLDEANRAILVKYLDYSHGIILVTGPTGSGKTTTLYGALTQLNSAELNILTIEDPIEYNSARHLAGAGCHEEGAHLRGGPALVPAPRPRRDDGR